jgi:hypothetical protein
MAYWGSVIPAEEVLKRQVLEGWYDVSNTSVKLCHECAKLPLRIILHLLIEICCSHLELLLKGSLSMGYRTDTFPCHKVCRKLTLYEDAHVFDDELPNVILENEEKLNTSDAGRKCVQLS